MTSRRVARIPATLGLALALTSCDRQPDDTLAFSQTQDAMTVCPEGEVVPGIDVSYYQGDIDWDQVAAAGHRFAITRINHSAFMDPKFDVNWARIKEVGMIRGAYQYFEPAEDVAWQAQVVVDKLGRLGPGDLPAVIDVEETGGLLPVQVAQAVAEWILIVEAGTGKKPMIYSGKYFWQDNVQSAAFADHALWHAQYPNACQPPAAPPPDCGCPNIADQWTEWTVWQYSSSGSVPGISGNVDMNVFNGSYEQLVSYAAAGGKFGGSVVAIDAPATVLVGETFDVTLELRNIGGVAWTGNTKVGTTEPRDRDSAFHSSTWPAKNRAHAFEAGVAPGEAVTVTLTLQAPVEPGSYLESFGLVEEGVAWFSDQGGPPDDAIGLSIQVVSSPSGAGPGGAGGGPQEDGDDDEEADGCDCSLAGSPSPSPSPWWLVGLGSLLRLRRRRSAPPRDV